MKAERVTSPETEGRMEDSLRDLLLETRIDELAGGGVVDERVLAALLYGGLAAAADREALTPRTLRRRIRAAGMTASGVVRAARAQLSLHLLGGGQPIGEISSSLGYRSPRCFSRFIRAEFGVTPKELRRNLQAASV